MGSGRRRRLAPLALAGLLLGGCAFEPNGDHPIDPPAEYQAWFAKTEACSGLSGEFTRIRWYAVAGDSFDCPGGRCVGRWNTDHRIFIASAYLHSELVVRHEILHDLIGHPGHPDPPFGSPCPLTWSTWQGADSASPTSGRVAATGYPRID
jgi:hypothetical protein